MDGNTALASQVGVNISNAANISVAGETVISGVSSNSRGQGWRGIDISNNSILTGVGNMTFSIGSNSNVSWMGAFTNATITSDKNIIFQGTGVRQVEWTLLIAVFCQNLAVFYLI